MMSGGNIRPVLPYLGLPVIAAVLFFARAGKTDMFVLLWFELVSVFGYLASVYDLKSKKIPNGLVLAMIFAWVLTLVPNLVLNTDFALSMLKESGLGFLVGGGLFLLVYLISRKGLGGGDVKFMAAAGLYLGFSGTLSAMLYGSVLAALVGVGLILLKKMGKKDSMPLAPFLYAGILITVFWI